MLPYVPPQLLPASWVGVAIVLALVLNGVFLTYLASVIVPFLRRRSRPAGDARGLGWHFLVPCRDEEAVIGGTVDYLTRTFPDAHVWVIDDDSDDATADIVEMRERFYPRLHLVRRIRPDARTGKSDALNAAYRVISDWLPEEFDRSAVILGVIDADGRPAPGCLDVVAAPHLFGRPETGAVQIEVRMINRADPRPRPNRGALANLASRLLIRSQDVEFRAVVSAMQNSRRFVSTVAMGGNGQFMRLAALDRIAGPERRPWRGSLQEDFEVGLHVLFAGSRTEYTCDTWVDQEALPDVRRLITQRTRWSQGMMQCVRYVRRIWTSPNLRIGGVLELSYCLVQPWIQLAATLIFPLPWLFLIAHYVRDPGLVSHFGDQGGWMLLSLYATAALSQLSVWGLVYWRKCERSLGFWRAVGAGISFGLLAYVSYLATWRAFLRILRGHHGWAKTRRNAEIAIGPTALET